MISNKPGNGGNIIIDIQSKNPQTLLLIFDYLLPLFLCDNFIFRPCFSGISACERSCSMCGSLLCTWLFSVHTATLRKQPSSSKCCVMWAVQRFWNFKCCLMSTRHTVIEGVKLYFYCSSVLIQNFRYTNKWFTYYTTLLFRNILPSKIDQRICCLSIPVCKISSEDSYGV